MKHIKTRRRELAIERLPLTLLTTSWLLEDVFAKVTHDACEDILLLTGERFGRVHILSRLRPVVVESRSSIHATASAESYVEASIPIIEHGLWINALAHSHPGMGPLATFPSTIDTADLAKRQRRGSQSIGMIFSRDCVVRFFSVLLPFRVMVQGSGVTQLDEDVFHIQIPSAHHNQSRQVA